MSALTIFRIIFFLLGVACFFQEVEAVMKNILFHRHKSESDLFLAHKVGKLRIINGGWLLISIIMFTALYATYLIW